MSALLRCAALVIAVALAGCAAPPPKPPSTQVVLLPQADGKPSAVTVTTPGGTSMLSAPYQRASVREGEAAAPSVDAVSAAQMQADHAQLLQATPAPARSYTIYFQTGGTLLNPESRSVMAQVLDEAPRRPGAELLITGHTDTQGSVAINDALSLRRANEMRDLFVQRGFPASHIETVGRGKRQLAVPTADNVNEPRNRRVEITVR
ncbi:MAG: OmpA family protein [Burkholderiales bacterium]|jgi:outer membrane protein OmpA-like peptidoglycan-associated protein|nr:OmpA family protein [Burkholderiales bacterium]